MNLKKLSQNVLLIILDGFGINPNTVKNAVKDAKKPNLNRLFSSYPMTTIEAGGESVGLPKGVAGNSEVGHMNLGAGRPVRQDLVRINEAIENHSLEKREELTKLIEKAKTSTKRIHLMGLLSDGGVHSHIKHLKELIRIFQQAGDHEIILHAFMDGRDTPPANGATYIEEMNQFGGFTWGSMQGRSIGMDRDRRWEKIELAYRTFTGLGHTTSLSPLDYLKEEYQAGRTDEFLNPVLFSKRAAMKEGDCLFFFNFRPDRAIQLSLAFNDPEFKEFERPFIPHHYLCMTPYIPDEVALPILFDKEKVPGGLSEYLSKIDLKQFKIAETEKYAHVTYFFNGGEKTPFKGEEQVLIPSPREVKTYNEKPQMSAPEVTARLLEAMEERRSFYLVNYANCDMVGHTGDYEAAVKAVEAVDHCVGQLMKKAEELGFALILTADHGNSDQMVYEDGTPHTSHTGAPVPFCLFHPTLKNAKLKTGQGPHALKDVAPTVLYLLGIECPPEFTGKPIFT